MTTSMDLLIQSAVHGYIECALWASTGDDERPLDDDYCFGDIADATYAEMAADVCRFLADNWDDCMNHGCGMVQVGHDLWLTRNGHGAGFWDRGLGEIGDRLSEAARAMGEVHLWVDDDGKVHQE